MTSRWPSEIRLVALAAFFIAASWLVVWRLGRLQLDRHEHYVEEARKQHYKKIVIQPERGEILDCRGRCLATSLPRMSAYVAPRNLPGDPQSWAGLFSEALGISYSSVLKTLESKSPIALGRRLDSARISKVMSIGEQYSLGPDAFWLHRETQRNYPRHTGSHIIGYCATDGDGDNCGMAGVELFYDKNIKGSRASAQLEKTAIKTVLSPLDDSFLQKARGESLILTIDAALQEAAEQALNTTAEHFKADAGAIIVQETKTGAIRAMCAYPGFDNGQLASATPSQRRNRCLTDPIEPGSVAKIFTMAILFDLGLMTPEDFVDCEGGFMMIHGRRIQDSPGHTLHLATARDVFKWSSNVGTVKAAQRATPAQFCEKLRRFGFGRRTGIDLPGEGEGILRPLAKWTPMTMSSLPMGYEMGLTPLQIINAISGIVNQGKMMKPYVVQERRDARGRIVWRAHPEVVGQIIRPAASAQVRDLMEAVVAGGTGVKAQAANYRVGGKTGTTRKSNKFDKREYIASFAGAIPIDDPQITILCTIDNPQGAYYAAEVSAPLFAEIATAALAHLAIPSTGPPRIESRHGAAAAAHAETAPVNPELDAAWLDDAAARMETAPGEMPDLTGLTMSEARQALQDFDLNAKFLGSGSVVDQSPAPGDSLEPGARAVIVFRSKL